MPVQQRNDATTLGELQRNFGLQYYKGIPLQQIDRGYGDAKARRFAMNHTNQNVWIPCKHLSTKKHIVDILIWLDCSIQF